MQLTLDHLLAVAGGKPSTDTRANMVSIIAGLDTWGAQAALLPAWRLAQYVAQIAHESGKFLYDKEVWGPTPAQKRYDTRTDLGNTAAADGDGKLYAGRTGMQLTGKSNYQQFRDWCWAQGLRAPDFVAQPHLVNTDPWEGLVPIWYWTSRNLNRYADENNIEQITKRINGGLNGYADRLALYTRVSLVLLGLPLKEGVIRDFQASKGLVPDDDPGPATRLALHNALRAAESAAPVVTLPAAPSSEPTAAPAPPVVVVSTPTPVTDSAPLTTLDLLTIASEAISAARSNLQGA